MNASNWKDGKATIAKILYKVHSYGKTFYEIFSFNSWKSVKYLCRNVTIDQRMTIFKSSNSRHAHSWCARYFIFDLGHNITMFLYQKVWKQFRKIDLDKTQLAHCSPIILHIFIEGHFHISLQSIIAVSLWFEQIEVPYVPEQENISKSEKSTCNCKKKKTESKQKPFVARVLRIKPWFPCENRATWS